MLKFAIMKCVSYRPTCKIISVSPLLVMKAHGDVVERVLIYTATALGRGRVASPKLECLYPRGKHPILIL